jgi:class 3 adenylate cyclase
MIDVDRWLTDLGLAQYAKAFAANAIDAEILKSLNEGDLKELGVKALGHRKKLVAAIALLGKELAFKKVHEDSQEPVSEAYGVAERRNLTVMFVDLVGSTAISARLDPEEMGEVLRDYQNAVAGEITRYEGHVAKFMGDGVLAYFGWPRAHEDEAERAVRAGLAVSAAVTRLSSNGEALACRVGIATGLVIVGDLVGEGAAQEEAVVGETPNLASRLQTVARPGSVVISDSTRRLVGDFFEFSDLGPQELKGLGSRTEAFEALRERPLESRFAARAGSGMRPIVGREQELALLMERWRQAESGEGQMVLLTGEAGIGKSRLAEALVAALGKTVHVNLRYQCSPYHTDSAFWPVIQQLGFAAGFKADDSNEARLDKLETLLIPVDGATNQAAALFAALLGLEGTARYGVLELTPEQRRNHTLEALIDQLVGLATRQPVLFVFEDAHWVDPTTLEMVELALDRIGRARVLMLITARPIFSHGFGGHPIVTRLALNRLGRTHTTAIIERITGGKSLPENLIEEITARTDGVPLYVEEMTKAVLESGLLRETTEAWLLDVPLSQFAIPTSLHDSLMARLDRLKPVKELAQTAAVIGRAFDHRTIAALSPLPEAVLTAAMNRLVEAELVFRRGVAPEATYLFKHALVRDAAYESLLKSRRQTLHGRLFDILEERGETPPEILAQHAEAAGNAETALDYWEVAGVQAIARPAYKEAIAHFGGAIRLCRQSGGDQHQQRRELQLQVQLGQALIAHLGYQAPATMRAFERARELSETLAEPQLLAQAIYGLFANRYISCLPSAYLADRFAQLTDSDGDRGLRCVGLRLLALERFHEAQYEPSLSLVEEALAIYDPDAHRDLGLRFGHDPRVSAMSYKAWNLWHLGYPDKARATVEQALSGAREIKHLNTIGIALCYGVSLTNIWLRDVDRVESSARESLQLSTEMSLALWQAWSRIHLGWVLAERASPNALAELELGLEEARRIGAHRLEIFHLGILADVRSRVGLHSAAKATFADAFATLARDRDLPFAPDLYRLRAASTLRRSAGAKDEAIEDLHRAHQIALDQRAKSLELRAARDLAQLWAKCGERQRAVDVLAPIYGWFTEGFDTMDLKEAKLLLDQL